MSGALASIFVIPAIVAVVFLLVTTYLQRQLREPSFAPWVFVWLGYVLYLVLVGVNLVFPSALLLIAARSMLVASALAVLVSSRPVDTKVSLTRNEWLVALVLVAWASVPSSETLQWWQLRYEIGLAAVLICAAIRFYRESTRKNSFGYKLLAISLSAWALLLCSRQVHAHFGERIAEAGHFLGPLPQILIGLSMLIVMFEHERRQVQDNTLALSVLSVDTNSLLSPEQLAPALTKLLERVLRQTRSQKAALCLRKRYSQVLPPAVQIGFGDGVLSALTHSGISEALCDVAFRRGGIAVLRRFDKVSAGRDLTDAEREQLARAGVTSITAVSLQSRDRDLGVLLIPHDDRRLGSGQIRMLLTMCMQIGTTLDNYTLMHEARRRTNEYELLTQVGQVISSRRDPEAVLQAIHRELGGLFDTGDFWIAFRDGIELRFEFETLDGKQLPKRSRLFGGGLTDYVISSGEPLMVGGDIDDVMRKLSIEPKSRVVRSFLGVPVKMAGHTSGAMCVVSADRENAFDERHRQVLQVAAGQVSVAMENALLFADAELRAQHMAILNHISAMAISSQDADQMLTSIVSEIQKTFGFDHIGIAILDYTTKDLEIKAEAFTKCSMMGHRIPLGQGVIGHVARTGEAALLQANTDVPVEGALLPEHCSVLCMPLVYGETMLGVLNIESVNPNAFSGHDELLLRTLADLVSTALHNALIFQKMQHQSITDALTGIKTRRYFLEALQSEWKRSSRTGRPLSVVLIDLDKFKEVNDGMGHLEGDLVLARVGRLLEQKCRKSNVVARYGGDEFVILMPETGVEQALILSERLRLWIASDTMLSQRGVTGSFGVASFPLHGATAEDIIRVADAGMYVSKHAGGNHVSTAENVSEDDSAVTIRHQVNAYVESFLQKGHSGAEYAAEFVSHLKALYPSDDGHKTTEVMMEAVRTLNRTVEAREVNAATHGSSVAFYAQIIGKALALPEPELSEVVFAASVHDVGKVLLPESLLNKRGPLTEEEFGRLKMHAVIGSKILECIPGANGLRMYVKHHHERMDGSGYPDRLRGEQIPLGARIIGLADAYVNMTTERAYAAAKRPTEAIEHLERVSGLLFDADLVRVLSNYVRDEKATAQKA